MVLVWPAEGGRVWIVNMKAVQENQCRAIKATPKMLPAFAPVESSVEPACCFCAKLHFAEHMWSRSSALNGNKPRQSTHLFTTKQNPELYN